jgi:hypothetical protein
MRRRSSATSISWIHSEAGEETERHALDAGLTPHDVRWPGVLERAAQLARFAPELRATEHRGEAALERV